MVYIFSGSKVIAEYDNRAAPTAPSREYVYGGAALLAKIDSTGTKYYHQDHLSNRLVTDSSGNTLTQMGHFPFGESWYNAASDKLLFTTYERDSESGNDYAQARYYISRLARFSALDPLSGAISDPQSLNRYPYVRNDPISWTDPLGVNRVMPCITGFCGPGSPGSTFDPGGGLGLAGNGSVFSSAASGTLFPLFGPLENGDAWGVAGYLGFGSLAQPTGGGGASGGGIDKGALSLCTGQLFGVSTISFTESVPGDIATPGTNGSFTGAMAGVFNGYGNPLQPGPNVFTVTNNVSMNWQVLTLNERLNGSISPAQKAFGYTKSYAPFTNFSARNIPASGMYGLNYIQIWELGNSLGFITGKQIPAVWNYTPGSSNEPG